MNEQTPETAATDPLDDENVVVGEAEPSPTGDERVDAALAALHASDGQPLQARIEQVEAVHARLQERLADVDE